MAKCELFSKNLICEVKKYEVIYNMAHPDRIDRWKRQRAWADISKNLKVPVQQCKAHWAGLRLRYKLEHSKMADPDYQSKCKYIKQINFLKDFMGPNGPNSKQNAITTKRDLFCRACLCPIDKDSKQNPKSYNIFNTEDVVEKLIQCTNQPIEASDKYPQKLCEKCYKKLLDVNKFQCMCLDSLDKFRIMLENQQSEMKNDENEISEIVVQSLAEYDDIVEMEPFEVNKNLNKKVADMNHNNNKINEEDISNVDALTENEDSQELIEIYLSEENYSKESEEKVIAIALNEMEETDDEETAENEVEEMDNEEIAEIEIEETYDEETAENEVEETCDDETDNTDTSDMTYEELQDEEECQDDNDDEISEEIIDDKNPKPEDLKTKKSRLLKCDICPQSFRYQHRFEAHQRRHQGLAGYLCTYENCDRTYNRLKELKMHINDHKGIRTEYKCDIDNCCQVYTSPSGLSIHKRIRHNIGKAVNKSYECETCQAVLTSLRSLTAHRYTHMDKSQWPFACDVDGCKVRFRYKHLMVKHLKRHAGIKKYICPHCGVRKTTSTELSIHINRHTFEKKYPCSYCERIFKSSGDRSTHIHQVHEGIKQNRKMKRSEDGVLQKIECICRYCGSELASPITLKLHEMTHTGEKPYACKICGRKFTSPAGRHSHERVHSDEKIYKCDQCDKAFKKMNSLKTHKLLHVEGAIPYNCEHCGQGFRWPGAMYAHKKKHHT